MTEENESAEQSKAEPGFAIEGNMVVLQLTKASFGLDLQPQKKSKASTWGSFEPNGLLPVAFKMQESDFCKLEDGSKVLSEQGLKDLLAKATNVGVPGVRTSYDKMLQREREPQREADF